MASRMNPAGSSRYRCPHRAYAERYSGSRSFWTLSSNESANVGADVGQSPSISDMASHGVDDGGDQDHGPLGRDHLLSPLESSALRVDQFASSLDCIGAGGSTGSELQGLEGDTLSNRRQSELTFAYP